jgi:glycosyltransferase involved in cell wall biosynthesis
MRVLLSALSCNPRHGSEALVGYKYAEALAKQHSLTVIASPPTEVPSGVALHRVSAGPCNFNEVTPAPLLRFEIKQLPMAWWLDRQKPFDVVHRITPSSIGNPSFLPAMRAPFVIGPLLAADRPPESFRPYLNRIPPASRLGWLRPGRVLKGLASRFCSRLSRQGMHLRKARKILVGTQVAQSHVPARFQAKCEPITYAGVEHDFFVPPATRATGGRTTLLYAGRIVPYKGLELLLRAVAVAAQKSDLRLRVIGSGPPVYVKFCQRLAADLQLDKVVEFTEALPRHELLGLYQESDIFCFPTLADTYGVALLEAMSCGCAVIVSDVAGPREIVADSVGIKVPMRDPEQYIHDYAEVIVTLAADARLRLTFSERARRHILKHHDWGVITRQVLGIYDQL